MMQRPEFQLSLTPREDAAREVKRGTVLDKVERATQTDPCSSPSHKTSPLGASTIRPGARDNGGDSERSTTVRQGRPITPNEFGQRHGQKGHSQTESPKHKVKNLSHSRPATPTRADAAKYQFHDREEATSTWCRTKAGGWTRYFIEKVDHQPERKVIHPRKDLSSSPRRTPDAVAEKQRTRRIEREDRRSASVDSPRRPRPENKYADIPPVRDRPDTRMPHVFGTPRHLRSPLSQICMDIRTNKALPTPPESDSPCELPMPNVFRRDSVNTNDLLYDEGSWCLPGPTDVRFGNTNPEMAMRMAQVCQSTPVLIPISMRASVHGDQH